MAELKELETKRDELTELATLDNEQASIYSALAHDKLVIRDEYQRKIDELMNGAKRMEPLTKEAVTAVIVAAKVAVIKEESTKEVITIL